LPPPPLLGVAVGELVPVDGVVVGWVAQIVGKMHPCEGFVDGVGRVGNPLGGLLRPPPLPPLPLPPLL